MSDRTYKLNINGSLLRKQRELLLRLTPEFYSFRSRDRIVVPCQPDDHELLDGLVELLDEIADQAHDKYQIDCLLTEDTDG